MKRVCSVMIALFVLLNSSVFAVSPATLAEQLQKQLISAQGRIEWNAVRPAFGALLSQVDAAIAGNPADSVVLIPQLLKAALDSDTSVAMFRMAAVKREKVPAALLDLTSNAAVLKARLGNLDRLIDGISQAPKQKELRGLAGELRSSILYLWLANMAFDPDSLNGPGFPPAGDGEFMIQASIQASWYEGDNQNFKTYLDAQDKVKELIQKIGRAF